MRIAILGAGAWGTALAIALAGHHSVTLWGRDGVQMRALQDERENRRYLPGAKLPANIATTTHLDIIRQVDLVLLCVPLAALEATMAALTTFSQQTPTLWACKGIEPNSGRLPHQILHPYLADHPHWGVLSGPSFATEVAQGLPTALTLASPCESFALTMAQNLRCPRLRLYSSTDLVGVEVAGALKNVIAIASGLADGLQLGYNARAALITRGLAEITRLGMALGSRRETFMGLAGLGDLVLTCTGTLSRNYQVGQGLARGTPLPQLLAELGHVAEGVPTSKAAWELAERHHIDMPITASVHALLTGQINAQHALNQLLARNPRYE